MPHWQSIIEQLAEHGFAPPVELSPRSIGGGCISDAYVLGVGEIQYFVKLSTAAELAMFEAEQAGLEALAQANALRVPQPLCCGLAGNESFLVMDYLPLGGRGSADRLGEQLAAMHGYQQSRFGWHRDNTIGATPQINTQENDWPVFWRKHRLETQLQWAQRKGATRRVLERGALLAESLEAFFSDYRPAASLLHGDLWSGNYGYLPTGEPVIFDPAVYFGDREADLAMTELFGGFSTEFYAAYNAAYPLDSGYATRKTLYNLYHILNHYNLFGGGYLGQAENMIEQLLSEIA